MIRQSFPIEDSSTDLEEEMLIQNLGKRTKRDLEVEVTADGAAIDSNTVTRPPTSQAVGVQSGVISDNRRLKRQRTPNIRLKDYVFQLNAVASDTSRILIPRSIKETRASPHAKQWECAINTEYEALLNLFKARLIVQDNTQLYGIDYKEVFAPIWISEATPRICYNARTTSTPNGRTTAFLNGVLSESIYMRLPLGLR
ncbi:LOW QUALITY PROTEIN: Copia-like Retrotransposon Polyprotein [Phytophthora palmivora]|uniref:Copia-like Retrotransposon Polyprotein n=1 Tax=Phytophthora palmivora TaxID=4796 RepID=A0A2P4WXY7_9STRA|nr:LOW QUALITY PROTEIN: Copia-like Retrotransposon Polyprotein [Phytophthora palmivora]